MTGTGFAALACSSLTSRRAMRSSLQENENRGVPDVAQNHGGIHSDLLGFTLLQFPGPHNLQRAA